MTNSNKYEAAWNELPPDGNYSADYMLEYMYRHINTIREALAIAAAVERGEYTKNEWLPIESVDMKLDGSWYVLTCSWNKYATACLSYSKHLDDWLDCHDIAHDLDDYTHVMPLPKQSEE